MTQPADDLTAARDQVGPVLHAGPLADVVIAAIRELNAGATIVDRGAYLRVLCAGRCRVTRAALERHRGGAFRLPVDLESVMPSFKGRLSMTEDEACWDA